MVEVCKLERLGLMQVRRGTVNSCVVSHNVFKIKQTAFTDSTFLHPPNSTLCP